MRLKLLNRIASITAFLMIICFMTSSLVSEFIGDHILIAAVKRTILYALLLLIICMILTAISERKLTILYPNNFYELRRVRRIKWIGLNGAIFLTPLAIVLNYLAQNDRIDTTFYLLQFLEIICGLINIFLFIKMFVEGKKINSLSKTSDSNHINE
jgi:uncharacterized membrane protein (DUF485 family)